MAARLLIQVLVVTLGVAQALYSQQAQGGDPAKPTRKKNDAMSDREKAGLRGPVKTCVEETVYPASEYSGALSHIRTTEYDRDGRELSTRSRSQDGGEWITGHVFDAAGRLVREFSGRSDQKADSEKFYSYDPAGRLAGISKSAGGPPAVRFEYDQQGHKRKIETFPAIPPEARSQAAATAMDVSSEAMWEAAAWSHFVSDGGTVITDYNERDEPAGAEIRDSAGRLVARMVRSYDAQGHVLKDEPLFEASDAIVPAELKAQLNPAQLKAVGGLIATHFAGLSRSFAYDRQGRVKEKRQRMGALFEQVTTFQYNEQGDVVEELATQSQLEGPTGWGMDDEGNLVPEPTKKVEVPLQSPAETRYSYVYDSYGNWIERIASRHSGAKEPLQVSATHRRTISYYSLEAIP